MYAGELRGLQLALDLALKHSLIIRRLTIFTDNQAAIQAVTIPRNHSGQYLVHGVRERLRAAQMLSIRVAIHWVPSHVDIDGNEQADILAKMATGWREGEGEIGPKALPSRHFKAYHQQRRERQERGWKLIGQTNGKMERLGENCTD